MQYFGIPTCPYCKKHVNLVRTWRLKREGEYKCPRCGGLVLKKKNKEHYYCYNEACGWSETK